MYLRCTICCIFFILLYYFSLAGMTQQGAVINYFDSDYFVDAKAFTMRQQRGKPYLTNVTTTLRYEVSNNVTFRIVIEMKALGPLEILEMKVCDTVMVPWIKLILDTKTNVATCPVPAGAYALYNLELPPKRMPFVVPKGEGTLNCYFLKTSNKKVILHASLKLVSA